MSFSDLPPFSSTDKKKGIGEEELKNLQALVTKLSVINKFKSKELEEKIEEEQKKK